MSHPTQRYPQHSQKGAVRSEFLLCSELTSPSLPQVSRTIQLGICFPWEGSWHKCCAGLPAAFGASQGEATSVNNDLNFQHQQCYCEMAGRGSAGYCCGEGENERREPGREPAGGTRTAHFQTGRGCAHTHLRWTHAIFRDSSCGKSWFTCPDVPHNAWPGAAPPLTGHDKEGD